MNTPLALGASLLAVLVWLISRRRPQLQQAAGLHPAVPGAAVTRLASISGEVSAAAPGGGPFPSPRLSRAQRLAQAGAALAGAPAEREKALLQLGQWGDRAALPLLQRGLRDPHPQVVLAAAQAMERFRGRTAGAGAFADVRVQPVLRLPRNGRPRG